VVFITTRSFRPEITCQRAPSKVTSVVRVSWPVRAKEWAPSPAEGRRSSRTPRSGSGPVDGVLAGDEVPGQVDAELLGDSTPYCLAKAKTVFFAVSVGSTLALEPDRCTSSMSPDSATETLSP